jgi:predicted transglutaminase-like cysteine proteinase
MAWRHQQAFRTGRLLALACLTVLAAPAGVAAAGERSASLGEPPAPERPIYVTVGESTRPPVGWVEFCIEYRSECDTQPSAPRDVVLTPKAWSDMLRVNAWVNQAIKPMTDLEHWGVVERWNYPDDGYGDCEDYVLLKRRMLMQAGWPREALLITVVRDK